MRKRILILAAALVIFLVAVNNLIVASQEKPIIVCTTNVLGSIVKEFIGDEVDVVVLAQPGICPADYDMKPSDVYAVSKAKVLFYHGIKGEHWLETLIATSGNKDLKLVKISGDWNTPEGAKQYITWIGRNISEVLGIDLSYKINAMVASVDTVAREIKSEAENLGTKNINVVCMSWQKPFVKWMGYNVIAEYGPPEMLSAGQVANLTETAKKAKAILIIDNLQVGVDFGARLASEVGAAHVVLTNFPGAIPRTGNLTQMLNYNAKQLFEGTRTWQTTQSLKEKVEHVESQLAVFQAIASIAIIIAAVEAVWLYMERKKRPKA
jgi:ABC-type Zn uptake system ZnuABC Zn-binding protein ZnuA